jgi:colicin import membrane protein
VVQEKPPPPKPAPPPEPEPQVKKPEIALPEKPKPKPKPEPKRDLAAEKRLKEQVALEEKRIDEQRKERELRELIARQQAAARDKALLTWTDKIRAKIRGNIILPRDIPGNPEAIFDVTLLPSGEVLNVRKRQSSGHPGYDDAVERAIMKSSPLPLPDDRAVFRRDLELKFRPQDR